VPRKAPAEVVEHRITLGNYERDQLKQIVNAKETQLYLQPFASVMPVVVVGVGGYFGLAYLLDWWPFEVESSFRPLDVAGAWALEIYENPDTLNNAEAEKLAELDTNHAMRVAWLADNPNPTRIIDLMKAKSYPALVTVYPSRRLTIIESYQALRIEWAAKAERIRAKMEEREAERNE